MRVFHDVRKSFGDDEVGARLDLRGEPPIRDIDINR